MKKSLLILLILCVSCLVVPLSVLAQDGEDIVTIAKNAGYPATPEMAPKGAIVLNAEDGQILWSHNENEVMDPASTAKALVAYLTFEAISQGKITLDTEVVATEADQAIANIYELSNNNIVAGETYTVRDLLMSSMVASSNVATVMLGHLIHGNDDASFLQLMNETAKKIGMQNTQFNNSAGAITSSFNGYYAPAGYDPNTPSHSTAKDLAILGYHLLKKYPQILEYTNKASVVIKQGTPLEETLTNHNHSLPGAQYAFEGVDGLKTGSSPSAGFNGIFTAKRGDIRLIVVVMGSGNWEEQEGEEHRHYFVNGLLDKAFKEYRREELASVGQVKVDGKQVEIKDTLYGLTQKGVKPQLIVANNRLQVAGSIDSESGVLLVQEKSNSAKKSPKSLEIFQSDIKQHWPLVLLLAGLLLLVFLAPSLVIKARNKAKQASKEEAGQYSRRDRR